MNTNTDAKPGSPGRLTKTALVADRPTWCPGCGDFAVLAAFYKILEKLQFPQESIVTVAGIGCSSRIPYFVNTHGVHFIHGRALPLAAAISLARPGLHVFAFGGDGDGFSIGGNHLEHAARKNIDLTYIIMDNAVYGMTKNQTSPTSPLGYKSKTDPLGVVDPPVNPIKKLLASGATFIARTHSSQINHMTAMIERAIDHKGFSVVEVLSDCANFFPGAFDSVNPRKGGEFNVIDEKRGDDTLEDTLRHYVGDEVAAYKLANQPFPGVFGVFYHVEHPTKNDLEVKMAEAVRKKTAACSDREILQQSFERMK